MASDKSRLIHLGIDIGSTTVKLAARTPGNGGCRHQAYLRHGTRQIPALLELLEQIPPQLHRSRFRVAFCGSGAKHLAAAIGAGFIQELVAGSLAVRSLDAGVRTVIELGGQDAKIIFHQYGPDGSITDTDMRMNGVCAGGTGAFIDEIARLLGTPVEEFNALADQGKNVHDISGRCGVFAKTDIQALLNNGASRADIALSAFHALARQTIGGLAQGTPILGPAMFLGGPLHFNPRLVGVFADNLRLDESQVIVAGDPHLMAARGASLALDGNLAEPGRIFANLEELKARIAEEALAARPADTSAPPFFANDAQRQAFLLRHSPPTPEPTDGLPGTGAAVNVHIGLDGGSTTSKCVAIDDQERVLGTWYAPNHGQVLEVMTSLLRDMERDLRGRGMPPAVASLACTGYAELLCAKAFGADFHTVETVAHAAAALKFEPTASFVLDIGGQDMKAIFLEDGVITDICLNDACSAGCGSFLENHAAVLGTPAHRIASQAFSATRPADLGSRCTIFMNSRIISEQRAGKTPADIMAGLCRSVVENVFSRILRLADPEVLGPFIVVQGGAFNNDALVRAFEEHLGRQVRRPPHPAEMGAIGAALLAKRQTLHGKASTFIGFAALEKLTWPRAFAVPCDSCANHCQRQVIRFANGQKHVSGNRCARGETSAAATARDDETSLLRQRFRLLTQDRPPPVGKQSPSPQIGLPMVLDFWDSLPFWKAFFENLGFCVVTSHPSNPRLFQEGLKNVPSDTVCFPAKLAHGHIRDLARQRVDRIFMPMHHLMPPEHVTGRGNQVCAVVNGYAMVVDYADETGKHFGIPLDRPYFHWADKRARDLQLRDWMGATFDLPSDAVGRAIACGDTAQEAFRTALTARADALLRGLPPNGFAVVLAGRPYHNDFLVNHDIDRMFRTQGIEVIPVDALSGINGVDLSGVRADLTTPFHVRMFAGALIAARDPRLELVQLVSFGCGHDAIIADEVRRLMKRISGKSALILKLDESAAVGPLTLRVRSFIETVKTRRITPSRPPGEPGDPFPTKFTSGDKQRKTILVPHVTDAFSQVLGAAIRSEGYSVEFLPMAGPEAISHGKRYVNNDMCFPAQINIGEMIEALRSGRHDPDAVALGIATACDCRLSHYAAIARKALDDAGYPRVPIITSEADTKNMHPGFRLGLRFELRAIWGIVMVDALEAIRRRWRPYEHRKGQTEAWYRQSSDELAAGLACSVRAARQAFDAALTNLLSLPPPTGERRPRVLVIGEFLLNYHQGANRFLERYLESNGFEVVLPDTFDTVQRDFMKVATEAREFHVRHPVLDLIANELSLAMVTKVKGAIHRRLRDVGFLDMPAELGDLARLGDQIVHHSFTIGEGWLMPADILHHADHGVRQVIIVQPFGCLPNHIVGRGLIKKLKELRPGLQILPLDFDPDTSLANIENRLQLITATLAAPLRSGSA